MRSLLRRSDVLLLVNNFMKRGSMTTLCYLQVCLLISRQHT